MKTQHSHGDRFILVTNITGEYAKVEELRINIRYHEGGVPEAITLDNVIIPRIAKALDDAVCAGEHISGTIDLVAEHDEVVDTIANLTGLADGAEYNEDDELGGVLKEAIEQLGKYRRRILDGIGARVSE